VYGEPRQVGFKQLFCHLDVDAEASELAVIISSAYILDDGSEQPEPTLVVQ
jgi:hypothetical protein